MKTILITGFNGFIGTHLIPALASKYALIGLSNSKTPLIKIPQIKQNISTINENSVPGKISTIIHLAAISDVNYCQNNPVDSSIVNILGTQKILELARKKDANVIFLSTSHVYGNPTRIPIREDDEKNPQSIYSATKLSAEIMCKSYSYSYGIHVAVARLFSVYGPNNPKHSLVANIIRQLIARKTIQLGNISSKRDFLYVKDVVDAILLLVKKNYGYAEYNIGSGTSYSVSHICDMLKKISGKNISVKSIQTKLRKNDINEVVSDPNKIKSLGWKPKISLYDGLRFTYDWYVENHARIK